MSSLLAPDQNGGEARRPHAVQSDDGMAPGSIGPAEVRVMVSPVIEHFKATDGQSRIDEILRKVIKRKAS